MPLDQDVLIVWQGVAARRSTYDTLMWQTPALAMTAQAFLLTLALGGESAPVARAGASLVSLVLAGMCLQLMAKHRRHEYLDSVLLWELEKNMRLDEKIGFLPHAPKGHLHPVHPVAPTRIQVFSGARMSSFKVWMVGQTLFLVVAVATLATVLLGFSSVLDVAN